MTESNCLICEGPRWKPRGNHWTRIQAVKARGDDCWICGMPILFTAWDWSSHHPCAPSIDHVIKKADGGCDHIGNLRLTHFYCNTNRDAYPSVQFTLGHDVKVRMILRENGVAVPA